MINMEIKETIGEYQVKIFKDNQNYRHVEILNTNTLEIFNFQYLIFNQACSVLITNFESNNIDSDLIYTIIQKYD